MLLTGGSLKIICFVGVMPDPEIEQMLLNIFGRRGHPLRKYWRMMYWMPKFKHLSPWPIPNPLPNDAYELARIAVARICSVDLQSKVTIYQVCTVLVAYFYSIVSLLKTADISDAIEATWIVSGQSLVQQNLLQHHKQDEPIYVEGSFKIWLRDKLVNYFILRANPNPRLGEEADPDGKEIW